MAADARHTYELTPLGTRASGGPHRLARITGVLVGAVVDDAVSTWLMDPGGQLTLLMWPRDFHARFDPLELLDGADHVVATGGETVAVVGGYLPSGDERSLGYVRVFAGAMVLTTEQQDAD